MSAADNYQVVINDALGNPLLMAPAFQSLDYTLSENEIGPLELVLPGDFDLGANWKKDGLIEVWRSVSGGQPYLEGNKLWLLRDWQWKRAARQVPFWTLSAFECNSIISIDGNISRRDVDYAEFTIGFTHFVAVPCDDIMRAVMRQNFGTLATDTTRDISTYLSIGADLSAAPIANKDFARQPVLKVLQDLARTSYEKGTYLVFDIACVTPPSSGSGSFLFQFNTFTGQLGIDHTFPNGNPPLILSPELNNLDNVVYAYEAQSEITRGIATGQAYGISQAVARADDTARQGESPFGLIESTRNAAGAANATALTDEALAELRAGIPRETLTGSIVNNSGLLYGLDWRWGDYVTAQVGSKSFNAHINRVHVRVDRDNETIDGSLRGNVAGTG